MLIRLVKTKEVGKRWTSGHRDEWTQCAIVLHDRTVILDKSGSCHNPNPYIEDLQATLSFQVNFRGFDPQLAKAILEGGGRIVEFFNSVEEGEKLIEIFALPSV